MEHLKKLIEKPLKDINLVVDSITFTNTKPKQLNIILDSEDVIDLDKIVLATNIISPIIDESNFTNEQYVLDVSSKEKGGVENE